MYRSMPLKIKPIFGSNSDFLTLRCSSKCLRPRSVMQLLGHHVNQHDEKAMARPGSEDGAAGRLPATPQSPSANNAFSSWGLGHPDASSTGTALRIARELTPR